MKILSLLEDHIAEVLFPKAQSDTLNTNVRKELPDLDSYNLVIFAGGTDIGSYLYGENAVHTNSEWPSTRDIMELAIFRRCVARKIPMLGICRGAQLLHVLNGGQLAQHIVGHPDVHDFSPILGEKIIGNTTHHQALIDNDFDVDDAAEVFLYEDIQEAHNEYGLMKNVYENIEACFYPKTRTLCIQGHPEYMDRGHPWHDYCVKLIGECFCEL